MTIPEQAVEKTLVEKRIGKYEHDLARHSAPSQPDGICKCPACIIDRGILAELKYMQMVERNSQGEQSLVGVERSALPQPQGREEIARALENAALFLEIGARYAPNEVVDQRIIATKERLKLRGLADVMRAVAEDCRALSSAAGQEWREPEGWQLVPKELTEDMAAEIECSDGTDEGWQRALASCPPLPPPVAGPKETP